MQRIALCTAKLFFLVAVLMNCGTLQGKPASANKRADAPDDQKTDPSITDLSSPKYLVREAAERKLLDRGAAALPALRQALKRMPSLDLKLRLESIVQQIEREVLNREIQHAVATVNAGGGIDRFIDLMVNRPGFATDQTWKTALRLAQAIAWQSSEIANRGPRLPRGDYLQLPTAMSYEKWRSKTEQKRLLLHGHRDQIDLLDHAFVLNSGSFLIAEGRIRNSVLLIDGDFGSCRSLENCIVFCTGNVGSMDVENSVIVAAGHLRGGWDARRSLMQAASGVGKFIKSCENNVYVNPKFLGHTEADIQSMGNRIVHMDRSPLQRFKLFDLAFFGLEVAARDGTVTVAKVAEEKPFARAGLKVGDRIVSIDGIRVFSIADVRCHLRRKLPGDIAVIKFGAMDHIRVSKVEF